MRSALLIVWLIFIVTLAGCEGEKDPFSGLSDLVAERKEVRRTISKKTALEKNKTTQHQTDNFKDSNSPRKVSEQTISADILYEREIEVVDSQSGTSLAKGRAYMNKQGRIVKIKIINN